MTLYVLTYNNYYNRIIKLDSLQTLLDSAIYQQNDVNFNPNDSVDTTIDLGTVFNPWNSKGDYLIAEDDNGGFTRWFIIEANRNNSVQYRVTLHRDLVADYWDSISQAPVFIEKAFLNTNDSGIFNKEGLTYNQILTKQTLLQDETRVPWIVGYIPRDAFETDTTVELNTNPLGTADIQVQRIADWAYADDVDVIHTQADTKALKFGFSYLNNSYYVSSATQLPESTNLVQTAVLTAETSRPRPLGFYAAASNILNAALTEFYPEYNAYAAKSSAANPALFKRLDGKIIRELDSQTYYKIVYEELEPAPTQQIYLTKGTLPYTNTLNEVGFDLVYAADERDFYLDINNLSSQSFALDVAYAQFTIRLQPVSTRFQVQIPAASTRAHCADSPYDIFCMPAGQVSILDGGVQLLTTNSDLAYMVGLAIPSAISTQAGGAVIYDTQLLPYCPFRPCILGQGQINRTRNSTLIYEPGQEADIPVGIMYFCNVSSFSFDIPVNLPELKQATGAIQLKVQSECDFHRLCSPNYQGIFEFNAAKNSGVSQFHVSCSYKPFSPFIQVRPNFSGLYGIDPQKDVRGLICGGDFSLPQVTSAWADYQLTNKTYQAQFDRQIQNLETTHRINQVSSAAQGAIGILGGIAGGAVSGGVGGAVVGGISKAVQGGLNLVTNQLLHNQALDYTQDNFNFNLQNIQAMPQGLAKTSAINQNNKLFPFLEYYTCTQIEKNALRQKIRYNGMSVGRIGTIGVFQGTRPDKVYVKGKLIRLDIGQDYHIINAISGELDKGVFI